MQHRWDAVAEAVTQERQAITAEQLEEMAASQTDLSQLGDFSLAQRRTAQSAEAATGVAAQLGVAPESIAAQAAYVAAGQIPVEEAANIDEIPEFQVAAQRTAPVGEAAQRIANELGEAPAVDLEGREAILGEAPKGSASQIGGIPTAQAAQMQAVTGKARKMAAADMARVTVGLPEEVTAVVMEDPATVEAQLDNAPQEVTAAVAALPEEALVSTQMEGLLAGMEDGEVPMWARPAVDAINAQMASRGLSTSTVGRDALFNAIIQSALPMAQSNAQALQQRAAQNLGNQQQANLQQSQQIAQQRLANLANRQTAASQTAQMAQQVNIKQSEFQQQAEITTAQQREQARLN